MGGEGGDLAREGRRPILALTVVYVDLTVLYVALNVSSIALTVLYEAVTVLYVPQAGRGRDHSRWVARVAIWPANVFARFWP